MPVKIEVFIPAYNCRATLPRTLHSLAAQTDKDFGVCVADDCSDPPIRDICKCFKHCLKLRYIRTARNVGCGMARQAAIDTSGADYLIPLDADDMLLPMAIAIFRQNAKLYPNVDFFVGQAYNEVPDPRGGTGYLKITDGLTLVSGKMYRAAFLKEKGIRNCEEFSRFADDTYFNMLSYELGEHREIPFPVYFYALNPESATNRNGGRDYWQGVVPKFLRCIEATTRIIVQHKRASEIVHLNGTLAYIRSVIERREISEEIEAYNRLIDTLGQMKYANLTEKLRPAGANRPSGSEG